VARCVPSSTVRKDFVHRALFCQPGTYGTRQKMDVQQDAAIDAISTVPVLVDLVIQEHFAGGTCLLLHLTLGVVGTKGALPRDFHQQRGICARRRSLQTIEGP
jgi:hypothetical protein